MQEVLGWYSVNWPLNSIKNQIVKVKSNLLSQYCPCPVRLKLLVSIITPMISHNITQSHTISHYLTQSHIISHNLTLSHTISNYLKQSHTISLYLTWSLSAGTFNDEETEETAESQDSAESEAPEFYASDDEWTTGRLTYHPKLLW